MALAILSVIAFLALIVWRFVFNGQQRRPVVREIGVPRQRDNSFLEQGLRILDLVGAAVIPDNRFENGSNGAHPITPKDRAQTYLRRVVALTGATQDDDGTYHLTAGGTHFLVASKFVRVISLRSESTCFSVAADLDMPSAEVVASALLKNNARLFEKWRDLPAHTFKANGKMVRDTLSANQR